MMVKMTKTIQKETTLSTEFLIYRSATGDIKVEARIIDENIWLSQDQLATLFVVDRTVITKHLRNIFASQELFQETVCAIFAHTASDGKSYQKKFYNLDAIIAVGYRVNSIQATHFRIWATQVLKEYIIKGFAMDDERLKNPQAVFGKDYFEEQLARVRDIRSSERRFYQKITDIYSQCSADYSKDSDITKQFFATVQNKLHWAISHQTAAEIIYTRADSNKENMGLTNWKHAPQGRIRKSDVIVAKNYLDAQELESLNLIVAMYLDFAELQAKNGKIMYMKDWINKLNAFLQFNEKDILQDAGKVTAEIAKSFAESEFEKYQVIQDQTYQSDFDKLLEIEMLK
jgi:hypothetical protein